MKVVHERRLTEFCCSRMENAYNDGSVRLAERTNELVFGERCHFITHCPFCPKMIGDLNTYE